MTDAPPRAAVKVPTLRRVLACAAALVVTDAFVFNQGAIAALVLLWMLLVALPVSFRAKHATVRGARLRNIGIYIGAALLVFTCNTVNNRIAEQRADALVAAVKAFQTKHQRYPKALDELVPEYIPAVPNAKYVALFSNFLYFYGEGRPFLMYIHLGPFGRRAYHFNTGKWEYSG